MYICNMNNLELQDNLIAQVREYFVQNGVKFGEDQCKNDLPNLDCILNIDPNEKFFVFGAALRARENRNVVIELEVYCYDENGQKRQSHSIYFRNYLSNYLFTL